MARFVLTSSNMGQMNLVWVGLVDRKTQDIVPAASAGEHRDYLNGLYINTLPDDPAGAGTRRSGHS